MSVDCPSCKQIMRAVIYHGAQLKICLTCKQFLVKPEQLKTIKANSEIDLNAEAPKTFAGRGDATYHCPECTSSMSRETHGKILKTEIDVCDNCHSIWMNKTAMTRIEYDAGVVRRNKNKNSGKHISCPKCGLEQVKALHCERCGIVIAKYNRTKDICRSEHKKTGFFEQLGQKLEAKIRKTQHSSQQYSSRTRHFLNACQSNRLSFYLMKMISWGLILLCFYLVSLITLYIFSNISMAPPKPTGFDSYLSRVSIFYIFAIAMAGPVVLFITLVLWRLFWYSLYGPLQALIHRYFHPVIKPLIAIGLLLLVLQSVSLFAHGFWTTYWWLNQQFEQAKTHDL